MSAITVFDPRGLEWNHWASLMVELFADQNLSVPGDESKWMDWALGLVGNAFFAQYEIPLPQTESTWQAWAIRLYQAEINTGGA